MFEAAELFAQREKSGVYVPREKYFQDEDEHKVSTAYRVMAVGSTADICTNSVGVLRSRSCSSIGPPSPLSIHLSDRNSILFCY